jgi:AraC-like DNA-binding protein
MSIELIDVVVRVAGCLLLLLLAGALVRDALSERLVWFFVPLALCLCGFLAGNTPDDALRLTGAPRDVAHLLSGYAAVFLWWFCLAVFDRQFRLEGLVLVVGLAWLLIASVDRGLAGPALADKGLSWVLIALGFGMMAQLAWRLVRDRSGDLIEARRQARLLVVVLLAGQLLVDMAVDVIFGLAWRPRLFAIAQNAALLAYAAWLGAVLLRVDLAPLRFHAPTTRPEPSPAPHDLDPETARLVQRLRTLIEVDQVHLDSELTFDAFVARMGAPERTVRRLINRQLGYDHFRAFLNDQRMAEARRRLSDPGLAQTKLVAIAFDSGFASLATFNRVFLASEGVSPSRYRAAVLAPLATSPRPAGLGAEA